MKLTNDIKCSFAKLMNLGGEYRFIFVILSALTVQTFTVIWWASSVSSRITNLEQWTHENRLMPAFIVRLDERSQNIKDVLDKIERRLQQGVEWRTWSK